MPGQTLTTIGFDADDTLWHNERFFRGTQALFADLLRDHADPNLNWVYERIVAGYPDVSDAGMLCWLVGISGTDEVVTIAEMGTWFGSDTIPNNGGTSTTPAAPAGVPSSQY